MAQSRASRMAILLGSAPVLAAEQASIVVDAASGEVLSSSDPTALWRPASLTKLMTLKRRAA